MNQADRFIQSNIYFLKKDYGVDLVYQKKVIGPVNYTTGDTSTGLTAYEITAIILPDRLYSALAVMTATFKTKTRPADTVLLDKRKVIIDRDDLPVDPDFEDEIVYLDRTWSISEISLMTDNTAFVVTMVSAQGEGAQ